MSLEKDGLVSTNIERVYRAFDEVHNALSRMDLQQLQAFKRTEYGRNAVKIADFFGGLEPFLRHDFTEEADAECSRPEAGASRS